ncbi:MAG: hypothetical protein H0T89_17020 [Deltaproteobacteria bacterium]|nr:hypothetical protein [Deltaproteobacteria bacterium]MDQ3294993.1 hypothetical protein [Myxococcota bacterium]
MPDRHSTTHAHDMRLVLLVVWLVVSGCGSSGTIATRLHADPIGSSSTDPAMS